MVSTYGYIRMVVRTNELIGTEWAEFDLNNALWIIPAKRMKMRAKHVVPLSRQVTAVRCSIPRHGWPSKRWRLDEIVSIRKIQPSS